ncbi:helix-turn-helix domain-containing protein [Streptomyces sp. NPDC052676]|uniref:helix-turn-helix domain-containing protein n=1 Tax=Streptomyces sp. NPDC052676 TaxID=3154953 RepID=UPI00343460E1
MITLEDWALIRRLAGEGVAKAQIATRLGISRTTVYAALASDSPPRYERTATVTSLTPFEARVKELLRETPEMPATVLAERVGWTGSIRWFRDDVKGLRPEQRRIDPADRLVWEPGDAAQCDLWFPPRKIPLEDRTAKLLPVLVITAAHSRLIAGRMIPTRKTEDLLLGSWELLQQISAVPRRFNLGQRARDRAGPQAGGRCRVVHGDVGSEAGAAASSGSGVQGDRRAPQRLVRDVVHAGTLVRISCGLQRAVHRLVTDRQRAHGPHAEGVVGAAHRRGPGRDIAVAPGLAEPGPAAAGLLRPRRHRTTTPPILAQSGVSSMSPRISTASESESMGG